MIRNGNTKIRSLSFSYYAFITMPCIQTEIQPVSPGHVYGDPVLEPKKAHSVPVVHQMQNEPTLSLGRRTAETHEVFIQDVLCICLTLAQQEPERLWYQSLLGRIIQTEAKLENFLQY